MQQVNALASLPKRRWRRTFGETHSTHENIIDPGKKILIVHPFLKFYGGAEYMLSVVANEVYPQADIFTLAYDPSVVQKLNIDIRRIRSPFKNGFFSHFYRELSLFYPAIIDTYKFSQYDVIISLSYAYVHGLITGTDQTHVSFILTPMRALWLESGAHGASKMPIVKHLYNKIVTDQRLWDRAAARRPDKLIAISQEVRSRIKQFWDLDSRVIYPPVDVASYYPAEPVQKEDYYITHSRLVSHKKIDLMIQVFKQTGLKLVIAGEGRMSQKLQQFAGGSKNITFLNFVSEEQKRNLLQKAKGYIFAAYEDFGMSVTEALASGTPVLAYGKGGATEIVQEGKTGMFFAEQTVESLSDALVKFDKSIEANVYKQHELLASVERFGKNHFVDALRSEMNETMGHI